MSDQPVRIALDGMGGDRGAETVIAGAARALKWTQDLRFIIFGDEAVLGPLLRRHQTLASVAEVQHAPDVVTGDAKPSQALRAGRNSSMKLAIDSVADGRADCVVSSGNTGALMAMAKTKFKTLPGIGRPAMVSAFPTANGSTTILDLGANIECDDRNLIEFAIMGGLYVRALGITNDPRIALLNIGVEDLKGNETIRTAAARLKNMRLPGTFVGFVEGDDIPAGKVDLVVTDGFTGNVALKTAEGTSRLIADFIRQSARGSFWSRLGFALAMPAFRELKRRMDPRKYNGAMLLGVRGICIKSHGGADAEAFATAIGLASTLAQSDINQRIEHEIADLLSMPQASVG